MTPPPTQVFVNAAHLGTNAAGNSELRSIPGLFGPVMKNGDINTYNYGIQFEDLGDVPPAAYAFYNGLEVDGAGGETIHKPDLQSVFNESATTGSGIDFKDLDSMKESSSFTILEDNRRRIIDAFAILDVNHLINDNNRAMMLRYLETDADEGYLARANYEIAVSNVYDMRETYLKTQQKIQDMTRLGEVQTYYKMYYGAKKKIILETIVVIVALIVLYALRSNGILAEGLFNLFFVIILFAYIFFRLSWQIVDFMSRDRRYFDKYDWGELDGSYNFHEFKEVSPEVVVKNKRRVTQCLERFFKNLEGQSMDYTTFENLMCSYIYLAKKDAGVDTTYQNGVPMYVKALWIVIYETLHLKYYKKKTLNERKITGVKPVKEDNADVTCPEPDKETVDAGAATESKDADITGARASCEVNYKKSREEVKNILTTASILGADGKPMITPLKSKDENEKSDGHSNVIKYEIKGTASSPTAERVEMDPKGIIRIWWWLNELKTAVQGVINKDGKGEETALTHALSGIGQQLSGTAANELENSVTGATEIGKAQTSSESSSPTTGTT